MMHHVLTSELNWMSPMCIGNTNRSTPTEPPMPTRRPARSTARPSTPTTPESEVEAVIATIARTRLDLETLESRNQDRLDFQEHSCMAIHEALRAAFEAGKLAARRRAGSPPLVAPTVIDGDIVVTSPKPKDGCGGWATGRLGGFRFEAKVYPEHAEFPSFEIGRSRISKLELRRLDTNAIAYAWDRGPDTPATDAEAQQAVDRLVRHLAQHLYGYLAP